jgi:hypothetical protein
MQTIIVHYFPTPETNILHCKPPPPFSPPKNTCVVRASPSKHHEIGYEWLCSLCEMLARDSRRLRKHSHHCQGENAREPNFLARKQVFVGELTLETASKTSKEESSRWIRMSKFPNLCCRTCLFLSQPHPPWWMSLRRCPGCEKHGVN